ncbi:MAG: serine/threonine protein kinase [Labilithrix sp.]|nr:serine/threonine protein kinase [Labilithrix sp.]
MAIGATKPAIPAAVADAAAGKERPEDVARAATVPPPATESEDVRIPAGTMVADRYRIARVLGEGGMGVVYAAEHVLMRKEVALKVLHAEMCTMPEVVARFEREAIAAAHIDHPNVAGATDFGRLPDGACYLVLELLRGTSLRDEIAKGPVPLGRALRILRGIASGVSAAHVKGIVHRDLKPENVMLVDRDGDPDFVKVLDFGIAKVDASVAAAPQAGSKVLTRIGSVFGTPEYMAPEQAVGDAVDARADLYALGVVFLEMLTGKCPFNGNALSILRERILAVGPPDMSEVTDPGARALIARLLTRQPDERMQTAAELGAAVDALLDESFGRHSRLSAPALTGPTGDGPSVNATTSPVFTTTATAVTAARPRWVIPAAVAALFAVALGMFGLVSALTRPKTEVAKARSSKVTAGAEPAETAPAASASPAPSDSAASAPEAAPAASVESAEGADPKAAPTASAASARAKPRAKPAPQRKTQPATKKTGPGGIYVPPPKDWFK